MKDKISSIFNDLSVIFGELEKRLSELPERPELAEAKQKLLDIISKEMAVTSEQAVASNIALPFIESLKATLPLDIPLGYSVEEDKKEEPT